MFRIFYSLLGQMNCRFLFLILTSFFGIGKLHAQVTGTISTGGDLDKFYPVIFHDGGNINNVATELELGRSSVYTDGSSTRRGSLIAKFRFHAHNWGHGSDFIDADIREAELTDPTLGKFIAGWKDATSNNTGSRIIIWLRGNTIYYYRANYGVAPVVYDGVQNALPYEQPNDGPTYTYKTAVDPYVNQYGMSYSNSAYFNGGNNYFAGNVGIGNDTPVAKLDVAGIQGSPIARFTQADVSPTDAYLNIFNSTGSPGFYIPTISGRTYAPGRSLGLYVTGEAEDLVPSASDAGFAALVLDGRSKAGARLANANVLAVCSFGQNLMLVKADGSVGINATDTKGYKLAVGGSMIAERIKVKLKTAWPDYVFQPGYQLPSLTDVEKYIKENQHLPEIPAAAEVEKEGLDVGEMNRKLLQKVEELTLYIIGQQKQINALQEQIGCLQEQNRASSKNVK